MHRILVLGRVLFFSSFAFLVSTVVVACGKADPGESCSSHSDCADGLICGKPSDKATSFACLFICKEDRDCPPDTECKGVDGTDIKGCRAH